MYICIYMCTYIYIQVCTYSMYEHIHIYMHMYVYSSICIIKSHYYWYHCYYSIYSHCHYCFYCCYYILYHVSYLHIRGQISGNSLERTSTLLVCIGTKSVKSQRLQALSASMKAAFFPRIPVPWPSESCSTWWWWIDGMSRSIVSNIVQLRTAATLWCVDTVKGERIVSMHGM